MKGLRRRVESRVSLSIMQDSWLSNYDNLYVILIHPTLVDKKVNSLMVTDRMEWGVKIIQGLFNDRVARLILSISLSSNHKMKPGTGERINLVTI